MAGNDASSFGRYLQAQYLIPEGHHYVLCLVSIYLLDLSLYYQQFVYSILILEGTGELRPLPSDRGGGMAVGEESRFCTFPKFNYVLLIE